MDKTDTLIELRGIAFGYPSCPKVLNQLDFRLLRGEKIGLTGPNGSGKSTLLYLIMGLLQPQGGEIEIFGIKREKEEDFREVRRRIGLLFQDSDDQLFCPTVAEEVAFGPLNLGKTQKEAREIVKEMLQLVGLEGFEERVTYQLSGGEKRRLSLAAVLAMKPEVLLLDEPLLGVDEESRERIIKILNNPLLSYLIVSQDRDFLERTTAPIYKINQGKIKKL